MQRETVSNLTSSPIRTTFSPRIT